MSVIILLSISSTSSLCFAAKCFLTFCYLFIKSSPSKKDNLPGNIAAGREVKWKEVWKGRPTLFKTYNTKIIPTLPILFKEFSLQEVFHPLLNILVLNLLIFTTSCRNYELNEIENREATFHPLKALSANSQKTVISLATFVHHSSAKNRVLQNHFYLNCN